VEDKTEEDTLIETKNNADFNLVTYGLESVLRPNIMDWRLVAGDIMACLAAPNLVVAFFVETLLYIPEWLRLTTQIGQPVALSALGHGLTLTICWLLGSLLTRAWEAKAVYPNHPNFTVGRFAVAGIIAVWLLAISTELVLLSQGISPLSFGKMGYDVDVKLIRTHIDVVLDCTFSFLALSTWRIAYVRESDT